MTIQSAGTEQVPFDTTNSIAKKVQILTLDSRSFTRHARIMAEKAGCRYLFELPGLLIDNRASKAAAILCPFGEEATIYLMIYNPETGKIGVMDPQDIPDSILEFAYSYVQVLQEFPNEPNAALQ